MDAPYWMCFECDHKQALGGPCEECGGSCHEVGDGDASRHWSSVGFVSFCSNGVSDADR